MESPADSRRPAGRCDQPAGSPVLVPATRMMFTNDNCNRMNCPYLIDAIEPAAVPVETSRVLVRMIDDILVRGVVGKRAFPEAFRDFVDCYLTLSHESDDPLWRPASDAAAAMAMADALSDAMLAGELTPVPTHFAARFVFSTLEGLQRQVRDGKLSTDEATDMMSALVLEGLAAPADPPMNGRP